MKSDSQRQMEYQRRRLQKQRRVTFWLPREEHRLMEALGGDTQPLAGYARRALREAICRQLLGDGLLTESEMEEARTIGREKFGVTLPTE